MGIHDHLGKLHKKTKEKEVNPKKDLEPQEELPEVNKPTILINNSFCYFLEFPEDIGKEIEQLLTYENEEIENDIKQCYRMINRAKKTNNNKLLYAMKGKLEKLQNERVVCWLKNYQFPTGHLPLVKSRLKELRYNGYEIIDQRESPKNHVILRWKNKPHEPRYYQQEMIDNGLKHERGVFEAAVGTGKSLVIIRLIKEISTKTLIIVPSRALMEQIGRDLEAAFGSSKVCYLSTEKVKRRKRKPLEPIRISTIHTLSSLKKKKELLNKVLEDTDALFVDEIHHAGAKSYSELLPEFDNIYYRFGTTGTFLRNDSKTLDMWGFLSNRLYHYPPYKAVEEGFLTPVDLHIESLEGEPDEDYQKEYDLNYCVKPDNLGSYTGGTKLLDAIHRRILEIPKDEQILILVDRKSAAGQIIYQYLKLKGIENEFISGDDKKEHIADTIQKYNEKKIRVLIGSTVIGEGVDVHSTQHLILANGGKSPIKLVQAIGRCVRLHPGKDKSYVYDFCFEGTNYLGKHCQQRVEIFNNHFAGEVLWEEKKKS